MENASLSPDPGLCAGGLCPFQPNEFKMLGGRVDAGSSLDEEMNDQLESFLKSSVLPTGANQSLSWSVIMSILQENNQSSYLGTAAKVSLIIVYTVLITVGILGNLIVAFVIGHRPELRTARNVYIINLTVSDVSMCLVCMPFTLVNLLHKRWSLGNFICKLVPVLQCTNILVSTATIVAIAADRYMTIVCVQRRNYARDARAYVPWSVAAIWVVSLLFPMPLFAYYFVDRVEIKGFILVERCVESWSSPVVKYAWNMTLIIMQYIIPIVVLSFVHVRIQNYLSSQQMSQRDARRAQREIERNRRITVLLTSIAVTFAICWLPWHVVNLLADFNYPGFQEPEYFYMVFGSCHAVAMSSACINPVLYGWLNTNLRQELTQVIPKLLRKASCPLRREDDAPSPTAGVPVVESVSLIVYKPKEETKAKRPMDELTEFTFEDQTTPPDVVASPFSSAKP